MKQLMSLILYLSKAILIAAIISFFSLAEAHLCDNVYRQADKLIVKPESYNLIVRESTKFKVFLQNNMDRGIAKISLIGESPAFDIKTTPEKMAIPKGARVFFTVELTVRPGIKSGNYPLNFRLLGRKGLMGKREFKSFSLGTQLTAPVPAIPSVSALSEVEAPFIDGKLTESCWRKATILTDFSALNGEKAKPQTLALIISDKECIYFGFSCLRSEITSLTEDERISIYLYPPGEKAIYYLLTVYPTGKVVTYRVKEGVTMVWEPGIEKKIGVSKGREAWFVEVSLPFSALGVAPLEKGVQVWRMNFVRARRFKEEMSFWAGTSSNFQKPSGFGAVQFSP